MTDRLTLARALEEGGASRDAAEHIATEIYDAIHDNVATKTDLRDLEQRLELRFEKVERGSTPWWSGSAPLSSSSLDCCLARCTTGRRTADPLNYH